MIFLPLWKYYQGFWREEMPWEDTVEELLVTQSDTVTKWQPLACGLLVITVTWSAHSFHIIPGWFWVWSSRCIKDFYPQGLLSSTACLVLREQGKSSYWSDGHLRDGWSGHSQAEGGNPVQDEEWARANGQFQAYEIMKTNQTAIPGRPNVN